MKKTISIILSLIVLILLFNGCSTRKERKEYVNGVIPYYSVFLLGLHSNCISPNYSLIDDQIKDTYLSFGCSTFIVIDGKPHIIMDDENVLGYSDKSQMEKSREKYISNDEHWEKITNSEITKCSELLKTTTTNDNEVDIIESFNLACKSFSSLKNVKHTSRIFIYDSGISTSGIINFNEHEFLNFDNNKIDEFLNDNKSELPDLENVLIEWYGIGETIEPQCALNHTQLKQLELFWREIIEYCGGKVVFISNLYAKPNETSNSVTPVEFSKTSSIGARENDAKIDQVFTVYFERQTEEYADKEEAKKTVESVYKAINESKERWYIIGCEAGKTVDKVNQLNNHICTKRAIKLYNELISQGVSDDQLILCSLGPHNPWHTDDYIEDEWIDALAKENRRVIIINESNNLLSGYYDEINAGIIDKSTL